MCVGIYHLWLLCMHMQSRTDQQPSAQWKEKSYFFWGIIILIINSLWGCHLCTLGSFVVLSFTLHILPSEWDQYLLHLLHTHKVHSLCRQSINESIEHQCFCSLSLEFSWMCRGVASIYCLKSTNRFQNGVYFRYRNVDMQEQKTIAFDRLQLANLNPSLPHPTRHIPARHQSAKLTRVKTQSDQISSIKSRGLMDMVCPPVFPTPIPTKSSLRVKART